MEQFVPRIQRASEAVPEQESAGWVEPLRETDRLAPRATRIDYASARGMGFAKRLTPSCALLSVITRSLPREAGGSDGYCSRERLRIHRDIAGPTMEVGAKLGLYGLEAIGDANNSWRLGLMGLGQNGQSRLPALRAF